MSKKQLILKKLDTVNKKRNSLNRSSFEFQQYLSFMDYKIRKQITSFSILSICGGQRTQFKIPSRFSNAFSAMNTSQKLQYYTKTIQYVLESNQNIEEINKNNKFIIQDKFKQKQSFKYHFYLLINQGFQSWQERQIEIDCFNAILSNKIKIDLRNYLIRNSKKKDKKCMVLQAIIKTQPQFIRFCFKDSNDSQNQMPIIISIMEKAHKQYVQSLVKSQTQIRSHHNHKSSQKMLKFTLSKQDLKDQMSPKSGAKLQTVHSIVGEIIKDQQDQNLSEQLPDLIDRQLQRVQQQGNMVISQQSFMRYIPKQNFQKILYQDICSLILPHYNLKGIEDLLGYRPVYTDHQSHIYIYKNIENPQIHKMQILIKLDPKIVVKALYNMELYKIWNSEVLESQIKMLITTQNTGIMYQKHKRYSQWYRERDFIFVRHLFTYNRQYYLIDKSIQNSNFIPFQSITRGKVNYTVWKISYSKDGGTVLHVQMDIDHQGLTQSHQQQLTLRYLLGFKKLESYFSNLQAQSKLKKYLGFHWTIDGDTVDYSDQLDNLGLKQQPKLKAINTHQFAQGSQISSARNDSQDDIFYSVPDLDQNQSIFQDSDHQLQQNQNIQNNHLLKFQQQKIQLDQNGLTILSKLYLKKKHIFHPITNIINNPIILKYQNILLKDDWIHQNSGGFKLINKSKIQAQNNVIKYMMKMLKKNLFSGKGLSGISLPVQIFNRDSDLQRIAQGLCLAPKFLEQANKQKQILERMKYSITFGLSYTLLCLDIQKPFNPILGQTYQGFISGCPIHAEQISHHPPISAIYFQGRGYKIYGSIEIKGDLSMNSVSGGNKGFLCIHFDDNQKIYFSTPSWELSGLTMGELKFSLKGKGYYYDEENLLFCQLKFQENVGYFSKSTWKYSDQIEGEIVSVTSQFMDNFISNQKKVVPQKKDIKQVYSKLTGRWPISLQIDNKTVYKVNEDLPYQLCDYEFPLNSNSNYREDIIYRKKEDIARCQIQKDRLQNLQRNDKKLREKVHGKHH